MVAARITDFIAMRYSEHHSHVLYIYCPHDDTCYLAIVRIVTYVMPSGCIAKI